MYRFSKQKKKVILTRLARKFNENDIKALKHWCSQINYFKLEFKRYGIVRCYWSRLVSFEEIVRDIHEVLILSQALKLSQFD